MLGELCTSAQSKEAQKQSLGNGRLCLGLSDICPVARDRCRARQRSEGRCRINLKGGNRGMCLGGPTALQRYGDLGVRARDDGSNSP